MERQYSYLKLRKIKRFRKKKEATRLFDSLENNMYTYKEEMINYFEDKLHVTWSWKIIFQILGFIILIISVLNINNYYLFFIYIGISALCIISSVILNNYLQSINRGYLLGIAITDQIIKEEEEQIRKTLNQ